MIVFQFGFVNEAKWKAVKLMYVQCSKGNLFKRATIRTEQRNLSLSY